MKSHTCCLPANRLPNLRVAPHNFLHRLQQVSSRSHLQISPVLTSHNCNQKQLELFCGEMSRWMYIREVHFRRFDLSNLILYTSQVAGVLGVLELKFSWKMVLAIDLNISILPCWKNDTMHRYNITNPLEIHNENSEVFFSFNPHVINQT